MQAEIIAIGDELASGQRLDTNSQWLSTQLGYLGIPVVRHTTIGDQLQINVDLLRESAARSQVVILTGGLGPTLDDLTRESLAAAFDRPLQLDEESLNHIQQLFARYGRQMPERNRVQAMLPMDSAAIPNPHGSAPGIDLSVERNGNVCRFFALPGVPAEMKQMWEATVAQRIDQMLGTDRGTLFFKCVKLFGMGESDVEARVPTLIARERYPTVGITVSQATITLRVAARSPTREQFDKLIAPTLDEIHQQLGELIFGYDEDELGHALLRELRAADQTLACIEIGSGSWLNDDLNASNQLDASGDQSTFRGGVILPDVFAARRWLGNDHANSVALDDADWQTMARMICERMGSSVGLVVGVYPSRAAVTQSAAGTRFPFVIAYYSARLGSGHVEHRSLGGHPDVLIPRVAKTAMNLLRGALRTQVVK